MKNKMKFNKILKQYWLKDMIDKKHRPLLFSFNIRLSISLFHSLAHY